MRSENIYTSIACNRTPQSADWGNNNLIVYAASNAVAILDPKYDKESAKVLATYVKHTKRVNTVKWLREAPTSQETYFLSGADDGKAWLWRFEDQIVTKVFPLEGHESGVYAVAGIKVHEEKEWLLATASADSTVRIWNYDGSGCYCFELLTMNSGFCFALSFTLLPKTNQALLAYSSDKDSISLWAAKSSDPQAVFHRAHNLSGHEDWVRGLDFVEDEDDLLLASCSQDNFIRLWRIAPRTEEQVRENTMDLRSFLNDESGELRVEEKIVKLGASAYAISLESVLYGHEGWVYGVQWHKCKDQGLRLLSSSIDKTLIIWQPSQEDGGVWLEKVRVGDVGGNSLGFFGGKFSGDGKSIFGHSYQGGFHIWTQSEEDEHSWLPSVTVGGHFGEARDLSWEPQGAFLTSVSADQTTRIHAPWVRAGKTSHRHETWHELARPQVHGYDLQSLAVLSRYRFASGAEEKIVRTFQAPANFIENFQRLVAPENDPEGDALQKTLPQGASVPSLGLSNKAVYETETIASESQPSKDEYPEVYFVPVSLRTPPQEETLMQNTLWPEVQKLYGHGFEIYALAASPDGQLLASSCRATNAEHAQIILWSTTHWKQIQKLSSHQLTVTQMCFSPDGRYLLSVSRDRRWSLFAKQSTSASTDQLFSLAACSDKTNGVHTRIIWACDWTHDSKYFATGSRDGKAAIWMHSNEPTTAQTTGLNGWNALEVLNIKSTSITALAFAPNMLEANADAEKGAYLLAIGFESGHISLYKFEEKLTLLLSMENSQAHHLTVRRLRFRPNITKTNQLASCGDDHLVRIYNFVFN